jgi:hypothetical protein
VAAVRVELGYFQGVGDAILARMRAGTSHSERKAAEKGTAAPAGRVAGANGDGEAVASGLRGQATRSDDKTNAASVASVAPFLCNAAMGLWT